MLSLYFMCCEMELWKIALLMWQPLQLSFLLAGLACIAYIALFSEPVRAEPGWLPASLYEGGGAWGWRAPSKGTVLPLCLLPLFVAWWMLQCVVLVVAFPFLLMTLSEYDLVMRKQSGSLERKLLGMILYVIVSAKYFHAFIKAEKCFVSFVCCCLQ